MLSFSQVTVSINYQLCEYGHFRLFNTPVNTKRSRTTHLIHGCERINCCFLKALHAVIITRILLFLHTRLFSASPLLGMSFFSFLILLSPWIHVTEGSGLIQDSFLHGKQTSLHLGGSIRTWMELGGKERGNWLAKFSCLERRDFFCSDFNFLYLYLTTKVVQFEDHD